MGWYLPYDRERRSPRPNPSSIFARACVARELSRTMGSTVFNFRRHTTQRGAGELVAGEWEGEAREALRASSCVGHCKEAGLRDASASVFIAGGEKVVKLSHGDTT